jgi:tripartite-type tricarboxylate transporter receptor subunit TctC
MSTVLAMPEVKARLAGMGLSVGFMTGAQLASREQAYTRVWSAIIKSSGFVAR